MATRTDDEAARQDQMLDEVNSALAHLLKLGLVIEIEPGKYQITELGRQTAEATALRD